MSDRNPGNVLDEIEKSRASLMSVGYTYTDVRRRHALAQLAYEKAMGKEYLKMLDEAKKSGNRVPAEDMRKAIAHSKIDEKLYEQFLLLSAEVEAADRLIRCEQANLSGLQSELSQLKVEFTHA